MSLVFNSLENPVKERIRVTQAERGVKALDMVLLCRNGKGGKRRVSGKIR
jgi:hypothetical protein